MCVSNSFGTPLGAGWVAFPRAVLGWVLFTWLENKGGQAFPLVSLKNGPAVCVQELTDAAELCLCDQFGNDQTDSENHPRVIGIHGIH